MPKIATLALKSEPEESFGPGATLLTVLWSPLFRGRIGLEPPAAHGRARLELRVLAAAFLFGKAKSLRQVFLSRPRSRSAGEVLDGSAARVAPRRAASPTNCHLPTRDRRARGARCRPRSHWRYRPPVRNRAGAGHGRALSSGPGRRGGTVLGLHSDCATLQSREGWPAAATLGC